MPLEEWELPSEYYEDNPTIMGETLSGSVFFAIRRSDGKDVLVKRINLSEIERQHWTDLRDKYREAANLSHPRLVQYYDAHLDEDSAALFVESEQYPIGDTLEARLNAHKGAKQRFPEEDMWSLAAQVGDALAYLHDQIPAVIHADLRPVNIVYMDDDSLKLVDYCAGRTFSNLGLIKGHRFMYVAPEICNEMDYDAKVDTWSLGCILHYMYKPGSIGIIESSSLQADPELILRGCTERMANLITQCLRFNPRRRFSASQVIHDYKVGMVLTSIIRNKDHVIVEQPLASTRTLRATSPTLGARGTTTLMYTSSTLGGTKTMARSRSTLKAQTLADTIQNPPSESKLIEAIQNYDEAGVRANIGSITGGNASTILQTAINKDRHTLIPMLVSYMLENKIDASVNARDGKRAFNETNLMRAAESGDLDGVRAYLHESGQIFNGRTALMRAANRGFEECVGLLLCELGCRGSTGETALMYASTHGHYNCARILHCEAGIQNRYGGTALMQAAINGHEEIVKLLHSRECKKKTEANSPWGEGWTALMLAVYSARPNIVKVLRVSEANLRNGDSHTAHKIARRLIDKETRPQQIQNLQECINLLE